MWGRGGNVEARVGGMQKVGGKRKLAGGGGDGTGGGWGREGVVKEIGVLEMGTVRRESGRGGIGRRERMGGRVKVKG